MLVRGAVPRILGILGILGALTIAIVVVRTGPGTGSVDPGDDSLRLYAVNIEQSPPQSWIGYITYATKRFVKIALNHELGSGGVYLGDGLVITAAHVVGSDPAPIVRIAGEDIPAEIIKKGKFEEVDLALLRINQENLPIKLRLRRMPVCYKPLLPGAAVVVATPRSAARSSVMPPAQLPADLRTKFSTDIKDVATTGNSGSGVFAAEGKCLLGIVSRKIVSSPDRGGGQERDIAKYFVPAPAIAKFIADMHKPE
jgi:S1-C subfamily serine protease